MLSRRLRTKSPAPHPGPVSRAQFQNALVSHQNLRQPANRMHKSPRISSGDYSNYENTSHGRKARHSSGGGGGGGVSFPSVYKPPVKSPYHPVRRAGQRAHLPKMRSKDRSTGTAWYHEDGSVNLQALADLGQRRSFPRPHSYLERLHNIHTARSWPQPSVQDSASDLPLVLDGSEHILPVQFLDDEQLSQRTRAERQSFLATLLKSDDLTEEDLDEIAHYFLPEDPAESPRSRPEAKKKTPPARSRSAKGSLETSKARSVHFQQESQPSQGGSEDTASPPPRPHSSPAASLARRPSDPFHVASPRSTDSSEEAVFLSGYMTPPELPASPRYIPEPKITYYDSEGEEIEEEIHVEDDSVVVTGRTNASRASKREASSPSPRDASTSPRPPDVESDCPPEHPEEELTPRVNRDSNPTQNHPRPRSPCDDSPRPRGMSESSNSPRGSPPPRPQTPTPGKEAPLPHRPRVKLHEDPSTKENAAPPPRPFSPQRPARASRNERSPGPSRSERTKSPKPASASKHAQSQPSKDSRPKSAKRSRASRASPATTGNGATSHNETTEKSKAARPSEQIHNATRDRGTDSHSAAASSAREEKDQVMSIPVISLTRGQLPSVPLRIQATNTQEASGEAKKDADSVEAVDSEPTDFERRVRMKDDRMKFWLTSVAWNRHVECVSE